jgi:hypothetical protein
MEAWRRVGEETPRPSAQLHFDLGRRLAPLRAGRWIS